MAQVPSCSILNFGIFTDIETYESRAAPGTVGGKEILAHPRAAIDRPEEIAQGDWTFEFQYQGNILCRQTFVVERAD